MIYNSGSRLSFLMDRLRITGKDLASYLHVDYSLVSKWKNGKRDLPASSTYLFGIAQYLLAQEEKLKTGTFDEILNSSCYCDLSKSAVLNDLSNWIIGNNSPVCALPTATYPFSSHLKYSSNFQVYEDNAGRRDAVDRFLDVAISLPPNQDLMLITQEDFTWLVEDSLFLSNWKEKLLKITSLGHKIKIIYTADRAPESLSCIFSEWLLLHLTGRVQSYYFPKYSDNKYKLTLFIIKKAAVVTGLTTKNSFGKMYTYFYNDPAMLEQMENLYSTLLSEVSPLLDVYSSSSPEKYIEKLSNAEQKKESVYLISNLPVFSTMPKSVVEEILNNTVKNKAMKFKCLEYWQNSSEAFNRCSRTSCIRHIYDIDSIETTLLSNDLYSKELSILCKRTIYVPRKYILQQLATMLNLLDKYENYEIALIPNSFIYSLKGINITVKDQILVAADCMKPDIPSFILSATEPTIVNVFYLYMTEVWSRIPIIFREKDQVKARLKALLQYGEGFN